MPGAVQDSPSKSSYRFTAGQRIARRAGFRHCLNGKQLANRHFKLFFVANTQAHAQLGIIASKRHFPTAVSRNGHKRMIREAFRSHALRMQPLDVVVMVRRVAVEETAARRVALLTLFDQLHTQCATC